MLSVDAQETARTFETIMAAIGRADRDGALQLATEAWSVGDQQPLVLMLAAERLEEQGEPARALELIKSALRQEQEEAELWRRYARLLANLGRQSESLQAYEEALDIDPDNAVVLAAAGEVAYRSGALKAALSYYERSDRLAPDQPDVLAVVALICAGLQDPERARDFGQRALDRSPHHPTAQIALARADLLDGNLEKVIERVSPLLHAQTESRVALLDIAAEAFDAQDRTDEAFKAYAARNGLLEEVYSPLIAKLPERRVDQARRIGAWLQSAMPGNWPAPAAHVETPAKGHAFILGFPRSGTTLLEKSLAAHPEITTLPEIDLLETTGAEFLSSNEALSRLAGVSEAELEPYRKSYWKKAGDALEADLSNSVVVDKLPLHTIALPLICRLFPQARIIFAIRDPRDVVLSSFRRRFQVNSAMYEFLTLERAASFYDSVMHLATNAAALLPLDRIDVRHEAVVADFKPQMGKVLEFLDLAWDDRVTGFSVLAKANPRTPSDLQLAKGLDSSGIAQWKRYRQELQPVMPILDPWVRRFGYDTVA